MGNSRHDVSTTVMLNLFQTFILVKDGPGAKMDPETRATELTSWTAPKNTGTRDVSERLRFDVEPLERWMENHVEGFAGPLTVSQFKGGQPNATSPLDTPSRWMGEARPSPQTAPQAAAARAVEREARVMSALGARGFPAPTFTACARTRP